MTFSIVAKCVVDTEEYPLWDVRVDEPDEPVAERPVFTPLSTAISMRIFSKCRREPLD